MATKLSEDQIKWILSLDVTQAEEGYTKLRQANNKLEDRNKELKKSLRDLEKAGKTTSVAYKQLSEELSVNNKKLSSNREMIDKLSRQMGLTNMTMVQLKRHAQDLQRQLDNTSKALHPEQYAKLEQQLNATKEQMNGLKGMGKQVETDFGKIVKSQGTLAAFLGNIYTKVAEWGLKLISKGKEFVQESIRMAAAADGVRRAFDALDQPNLLKDLRSATKGTVNDLELMKAAVKAKDFRIPLQDLGKYLQFAQLKAQQTGQSVEYMTDSIVTGLGRKSLLILDNLGLSAAEINEEVAKTGSFMSGVAKIVDKQLSTAGEKYISAADKVQQRSVLIQNIQLALGQRLASLADDCGNLWTKILKIVDKVVEVPIEQKLRIENQELNFLTTAIIAANDKTDVRQQLIQELNRRYPKFLENMDIEKLTNEQLVSRLREVNQEYSQKARIQVMNDKVLAPMQKRERGLIEEQIDLYKSLSFAIQNYSSDMSNSFRKAIKDGSVVNMTTEQINKELAYMEKNGVAKGYTRGSFLGGGLEKKISRLKEIPNELKKVQSEMESTVTTINRMQGNIINNENKKNEQLSEKVDLIEEKKKEIELAEGVVASTKEEVLARNKKVASLKAELEVLQNLGIEKKKTPKEKKEESSRVDEAQKDYRQELAAQKQAYQQGLNLYRTMLQQEKITKEQFDIYEATLKSNHASDLLEIEDNYYVALLGLSARGEKIKEETISQAAKKVQDAEQASFDARLSAEQTYRNNLQAMRDMIQAPTQTPEEKLQAQYDLQLSMLQSFYQASLEYAKQHGQDEVEVKAVYTEAKKSLDKKYQDDKEKLITKSNAKIKGIEGNELSNYVAEVFNSVSDLNDIFSHFSDPDFWENFGENIMETMGKLVNAVTGGLSSAFNTFQKIETDNVEAKYNAEIEAAQGNSEEVERLEQEKAQKKLDIEKKYADVQFAIKASEIIANTALAIMQCLGQLGPIAGPIVAGLMGATGAIQLAAANAERKKVKNMTLSGSNSSGKETGTRVATGREKGGKIDITRAQDGKQFPSADYDPDARGFIDRPTVIVGEGPAGKSKEWVASNAAVENPTIAPFLQLLDAHQQAGDISTIDLNQIMRQRMAAGYVSGGSISAPVPAPAATPAINTANTNAAGSAVMTELLALITSLKDNGIPAYVVLSELEKKQNLRDRSRSIGSKS